MEARAREGLQILVVRSEMSNDGSVAVSVADTGKGIDA
jgi:hypothetical protein